MDVAKSCKKSSFIEVHELKALTHEQSLELFNKKAFQFDCGGGCPEDLTDISSKIVKKCQGLPLAIVTIGGLLSTKEKNSFEWKRFTKNIDSELKKDSHLIGINEILSFSYEDLPCHLKSCLLYFGIYPEDYHVESKRLTLQWIAEGFVKEEIGKSLEEVADGYLTELIHRSLVQVSSYEIDGKCTSCHVHDLIRVMILRKFEDLSFCKNIREDGQSSLSGRIRRISIGTISNELTSCIESSHVRALHVFPDESSLILDDFVSRILTKCKLLKVLDFGDVKNLKTPTNLGYFTYLIYLRLWWPLGLEVPKSIGLLQNLETLDVGYHDIMRSDFEMNPIEIIKRTDSEMVAEDIIDFLEMPKEISKLKKLRHLLGDRISLIRLNDGIGGLTSLKTLNNVALGEKGDEGVELIREMGKLTQLREFCLVGVTRQHESALFSSISQMHHLEKLKIQQKLNEGLDWNLMSSPPMLRNISLFGKLERFPRWNPKLQNLIELKLVHSELIDDQVKSINKLPNLLTLSLIFDAYKGENLHFQDGELQKLKELYIENLTDLKSIIFEKGGLPCLNKLSLWKNPLLIPSGIEHLKNLKFLRIGFVNLEFLLESIDPEFLGSIPRVTYVACHKNHSFRYQT